MGGTCDTDANNSEIATAVLTIPQTINTNNVTGTITYQYHYHVPGCQKACTGEMKGQGKGTNQWGQDVYITKCNTCGNEKETYANLAGEQCGKIYYICSMSEGQIVSATITY